MITQWFARVLTDAERMELILLAGTRRGGQIITRGTAVIGAVMDAREWKDWRKAHPRLTLSDRTGKR
jgi:hypothetical protein